MKFLLSILSLIFIFSCGQKGALYLETKPDIKKQIKKPAPSTIDNAS
jgi:predicted small lipoprotein YifL